MIIIKKKKKKKKLNKKFFDSQKIVKIIRNILYVILFKKEDIFLFKK